MTRTEELTLKLLGGTLTDAQLNELEWQVASDAAAARQHIALLELDAALRGRLREPNAEHAVMAELRRKSTGMARSPDRPADPRAAMANAVEQPHAPEDRAEAMLGPAPPGAASAEPRRHRRRRRRRSTPIALYVSFGLAVVLVIAAYFVRRALTETPVRPINRAQITALSGHMSILRDETRYRAELGSVLNPGDRIETAANSIATLDYDPDHKVEIRSSSAATFAGTGPQASRHIRQIELQSGTIEMLALDGSNQPPIELITPHARVTAGPTRYVTTVTDDRTTVTVARGLVDVQRQSDRQQVRARSDQRVIVEAGLPLVALPTDSPGRVTDGLVLLYRFTENGGSRVLDQSGAEPSVDLTIAEPAKVTWGNRLLRINQPTTLLTQSSNAALIEQLRGAEGVTIEAWLKPTEAQPQTPGAIVSLASDPFARNITLAQGTSKGEGDRYTLRFRTVETDGEGEPPITTNPGAARPRLTHVVVSRSADGAVRFYIDGRLDRQAARPGDLSNWASDAPFGLANEPTGNRPWLGELRLVALYDRALSDEEVGRNHAINLFDDGPGAASAADPADPTAPAKWQEQTYLVLSGSDRSTPFTITSEAFRLKIRYKQPEGLSEKLVVRLRDYRDASRSQELMDRADASGVVTATAKFGAGQYVVEVLGPDMTDWTVQVEQRVDEAASTPTDRPG